MRIEERKSERSARGWVGPLGLELLQAALERVPVRPFVSESISKPVTESRSGNQMALN